MRNGFALILCLLLAIPASGANPNVTFTYANLTNFPGARISVQLIPDGVVFNGNSAQLQDQLRWPTDTNGNLTVTNLTPNGYTVNATGPFVITPLHITVTNGATAETAFPGLVTTATNNPLASSSYTIAASDARYVLQTNGISLGFTNFNTVMGSNDWKLQFTNGAGVFMPAIEINQATNGAAAIQINDPSGNGALRIVLFTNGTAIYDQAGTLTAYASNGLWMAVNLASTGTNSFTGASNTFSGLLNLLGSSNAATGPIFGNGSPGFVGSLVGAASNATNSLNTSNLVSTVGTIGGTNVYVYVVYVVTNLPAGTTNNMSVGSSTTNGFYFPTGTAISAVIAGVPYIMITNSAPHGPVMLMNGMVIGFGNSADTYGNSIFYNPTHGLDPEFEFSANNSFGFAAGVGNQGHSVFQWGTAGATHEIHYVNADGQPGFADSTAEGWSTNLIPSKSWGYAYMFGSNGTAFFKMIVLRSEPLNSNGDAKLSVWDSTQTLRLTNSPTPGTEITENVRFGALTNGTAFVVNGATYKSYATPESVQTSYNICYTNGADNVNLISTFMNFTDTLPPLVTNIYGTLGPSKDLYIYPYIDNRTNFTFPSWTWQDAIPTGLSSNTAAHLHLEVTGTNDASVWASWKIAPYTYVQDTNASNFISVAGITNSWERSAIFQLVNDLKRTICSNGKSLWTNLFALYPFVGTTSASQSYNLIQTNIYQITWHGSPVFTTNGVTGDGSSAWGDTGIADNNANWTAATNALLFVWNRTQLPTPSSSFFGNTFGGGTFTQLGPAATNAPGAWRSDGPFHTDGSALNNSISADYRGFLGLQRTATQGGQTYINSLANSGLNSSSVTFNGTTIELLANGGANFCNANLASAGFGTQFTAADVTLLIQVMQTFNNALNR